MKKLILKLVATTIIALMLALLPSPCSAQDQQKKPEDQKKQDKLAEMVAKKQEKDEKRYQKILDWSKNLYGTDPDFQEAVNYRYRDIRDRHSKEAYEINVRTPDVKLIRREGDKIYFDKSLYPNPMAQDFVNRVGQSLVPKESKLLYTFRILQDPRPDAFAKSIGTIYITTGYLALIDNEAQLAYILGHEIAHIEEDHWFEDVLVHMGTPLYMKKNPFKSMLWALQDAKDDFRSLADPNIYLKAKLESTTDISSWQPFQEDEADRDGLKYMFARDYDVREVPKLYERMKRITADARAQTGFIADPRRLAERFENVNAALSGFMNVNASVGAVDLADRHETTPGRVQSRGLAKMLNETLAPEIKRKLDSGELNASSEEFQSTMALVKRDNGIRALQFDMFGFARVNLEDSLAIRSNDPLAYYYYGKTLKQTARNAADMSNALKNLNDAIANDKRETIAEPYLFRAMLRLGERNPTEAPRIANDLRKYVEIFQRENSGRLPPDMEFVYDFMQDLDVLDYRAVPAENTADAPKAVFGTQPLTPAGPTATINPNVIITPAPTPKPSPVKGGRPVKRP
jgi:hypothetical protein